MAKITKQLTISGRVQGVGLRYSLCDEALRLGAKGWVKNMSDGTVQAVVQAEPNIFSKLIDFIKKNPGLSQIDHVEETDASGDFADFEIRY